MSHILELNNVSKAYNQFKLDNISFNLEKGYIMGFIGPNGAGKSTTIKLIMNLIKKDSGSIKIFGKDHKKNEIEIKQRIGFVYDENYFYEDLSIIDMKNIVAPFYKNWDEKAFQNYIKEFNLSPKHKIKELSKGMKMKYSLALALSHKADLIIMDEPTSGLDPIIRNELLEILYEIIQDEEKGILFSTHNTTDLDKIADYITFINNGKMVLTESKDEIVNQYKLIKGGKDILSSHLKEKLIGVKEHNYGFEALTTNSTELKRELRNEIIIENATLEDIMLFTIKGERK